MAKRNKKKLKGQMHKAASLNSLSPEMLMERGNLLLKQEKFQDAIACFKHLLKLEQKVEFLHGLEQAYLGRIKALVAKSMIKEAIALLDTLVQRCPDVSADPLRLSLLLQFGSYTEAAGLYTECHGQLAPEQQRQMETLFGALLLAGNSVNLVDFEVDSPIVRIYPKALVAIDMFCTGQADKLEEALRQIPIRSPYRDLRTLLTGLHHFSIDKAKASEVLQKITADSPYYFCAAGFFASAESPKSLLANLAATPKADRSRLPELHGLPASHVRVLEELARADGKPMHLYQIIRRNERCFDKKKTIQLYRNILPFCRNQAVDILERSAAFSISEKYRLEALAAEKDDMPSFAVAFWSDYLGTIDRKEQARHREIAMVIRRQATLMKKDRYDYSPQEILETMLKSLEYDPGHAPTWLDASEYARRYDSMQQHYAIIQDAVQKLPEEVSILLAAMRASSNRGAHKKAAGLASRVLELDPINTAALDFLVASRLEHGRKLASQKKWTLAEKELLAADTRARSVRFKGRSRICLGMLLLLQNNNAGLQHIDAGQQENPYPLLGHVLVALEARLYCLTKARQKEFDNLLKQHADATQAIDPIEFHRLISWILGFENRHWPMLKEVCQVLKGYFAKAAVLDLSHTEGLSLCRALEQIDLTMALVKCSTTLKKKYPDVLEFKVWYLLAFAWKSNKPLTSAAHDKLEDLFDRLAAKQQFDFIEHIEDILERRELNHPSYYDYDDYDDFDDFNEEYVIDFGPFGTPKIMPDQKKQKEPVHPPKSASKQLNLFDDE
jgi:cellulose synthase operon protein C